MEDFVGIINEFMHTFGTQINSKKSFYTARVKGDSNSASTSRAQPKLTRSPTTEGVWTGGLDGKWTPEMNPSTRITIRQFDEAIRYLGVHFSMNGDWSHQVQILNTALVIECLCKIRRRNLPNKQLKYLMNTIILPKLTFPLNIISILTSEVHTVAIRKFDKIITDFTKAYSGLPTGLTHKFVYKLRRETLGPRHRTPSKT
jgi:hypothetical protein